MNVTFVTVYKFKMYLSERLKIKFKCTVQVFFRLGPHLRLLTQGQGVIVP